VAGLLAELSASGRFAEVALSFAHAASAPVARMDAEALADLVETPWKPTRTPEPGRPA
jgi:hypothetical protein